MMYERGGKSLMPHEYSTTSVALSVISVQSNTHKGQTITRDFDTAFRANRVAHAHVQSSGQCHHGWTLLRERPTGTLPYMDGLLCCWRAVREGFHHIHPGQGD
jgi:hypothetical protein